MNIRKSPFFVLIITCLILSGVFYVTYISSAQTTQSSDPFENFNAQKIPKILGGLACWFVRFGLIVTGIAIVAVGIAFALSRGNPTAFSSAKKFLTYVIIGGLVIYGVYTIILTVSVLVTGSTVLPWVPLSCS